MNWCKSLFLIRKEKLFVACLLVLIIYSNFGITNGKSISPFKANPINKNIIENLFDNNPTNYPISEIQIAKRIEKIESDLLTTYYTGIEECTEKQIKEKSLDIIILFEDSMSIKQRADFIQRIAPSITIKYNYHIIPALSVTISLKEFGNLMQITNDIRIQYISLNHKTKIDSTSLMGTIQNENWSAPFSYDNWWLSAINATNTGYTGKGVKLAVMDTGISVHPDFFTNGDPGKSRIVLARSFGYEGLEREPEMIFDDYGHGTHVAGIAAGNGYLSQNKYRGVAPEADIVNAKIFNSTGEVSEDDIISAIEWCVNQSVDVINMSFGSSTPEVWNAETIAIKKAVEQGTIVVAAAGNDGPDFYTGGSPGSGIYSISVGATDINNHITGFSSLGPSYTNQLLPEIVAPGENIISALGVDSKIYHETNFLGGFIEKKKDFAYVALSGTSMAAPIVSGAIALLLEAFPNASPESIRNALIMTSHTLNRSSPEGYGVGQGAGLIDVKAALDFLNKTQQTKSSVNDQALLYPRSVPYGPFDFLNFPGDHQVLNLSLFNGMKNHLTLEIQSPVGIQIISSQVDFNFETNGIASIPLDIQILYNCAPGLKTGELILKDPSSGSIYDSIPLIFNITIPMGKIYFDAYHGYNDAYPQITTGISQITLYHALRDLVKLNYQPIFKMENWSFGYDAEMDARIINPNNLYDKDILVLQTPILPYSDYEIHVIKTFFNRGGSILYLGTKSDNICVESMNKLFSMLDSGIEINRSNIMNIIDYGFSAGYIPFNVHDIDKSHAVFNQVDQYLFGFGHTFNIQNAAINLSSINGKIIASAYDGGIGKGRIVALSDYRMMRSSFYNDPFYYGNHSKFVQNIMNYLEKDIDGLKISINAKDRLETNPNLDIALSIWDSQSKTVNSTLKNGTTINATLILNASTQRTLNVSDNMMNGVYEIHYLLGVDDISNQSLEVQFNLSLQSQIVSRSYFTYYYPSFIGYTNISLSNNAINRSISSIVEIIFESPNSFNFTSYFSITTNRVLANRPIVELTRNGSYIDGKNYVNFIPSECKSAGLGLIYAINNVTINNNSYLDLSPDRFQFWIINYIPRINTKESNIGSVPLSDTENGEFIIPQIAQLGGNYELNLKVNESVGFEDKIENLSVTCTLLPVLIVRGSLSLLYPNDIIRYEFTFDTTQNIYKSTVVFPMELNWTVNDQIISHSLETDGQYSFVLLWMTVKDLDGGSDEFIIIYYLFKNEIVLDNTTPMLTTFGILAISVILLNLKRKNLNPRLASPSDLHKTF